MLRPPSGGAAAAINTEFFIFIYLFLIFFMKIFFNEPQYPSKYLSFYHIFLYNPYIISLILWVAEHHILLLKAYLYLFENNKIIFIFLNFIKKPSMKIISFFPGGGINIIFLFLILKKFKNIFFLLLFCFFFKFANEIQ